MIIDTNALSALIDGDPNLGPVLSTSGADHLPVIVIGEYAFGLARSRHRKLLQAALESAIDAFVVLDIETTTAGYYAEIRDEQRLIGRPIPDNDLWIAALARQHRLPIVSLDKHYDLVAGIERIEW